MARTAHRLADEAFSLAALQRAWLRAARGKRRRIDVAGFERAWPSALVALSDSLLGGVWRPGPYRTFPFEERGKRRLISAAPFADRVVHHAVTAAIEPIWEARFLPWSFANRVGRGTHAALARAARGAARFRWALKLDVQRFFPSVDHAVLSSLVERHLADRPLLELLGRIIASGAGILTSEWKPVLFPGDELLALARPKGLPIGNQTSQFLANVYLHPLDLFVAQAVKPGLAARYVDDLVLFDHDRGRLHDSASRASSATPVLRMPTPCSPTCSTTIRWCGARTTTTTKRRVEKSGAPLPPAHRRGTRRAAPASSRPGPESAP